MLNSFSRKGQGRGQWRRKRLADQTRNLQQQTLRGCIVFNFCKRILKDQAVNIYIFKSKQICVMTIVHVTAFYVPRIGLCGLYSLHHFTPSPKRHFRLKNLLDKFLSLHFTDEDTKQLGNTWVLTGSRTEFKLVRLKF